MLSWHVINSQLVPSLPNSSLTFQQHSATDFNKNGQKIRWYTRPQIFLRSSYLSFWTLALGYFSLI